MASRTSRIQGFGLKGTAAAPTLTLTTLAVSDSFKPTNRGEERAQMVVSNLAAAGSGLYLVILSTDGKEALPVFPETSVTFETDGEFRIYNPQTSSISYMVGELFLRGVTAPVGGPGFAGSGSAGGGSGTGGGGVGGGEQSYGGTGPGRYLR